MGQEQAASPVGAEQDGALADASRARGLQRSLRREARGGPGGSGLHGSVRPWGAGCSRNSMARRRSDMSERNLRNLPGGKGDRGGAREECAPAHAQPIARPVWTVGRVCSSALGRRARREAASPRPARSGIGWPGVHWARVSWAMAFQLGVSPALKRARLRPAPLPSEATIRSPWGLRISATIASTFAHGSRTRAERTPVQKPSEL